MMAEALIATKGLSTVRNASSRHLEMCIRDRVKGKSFHLRLDNLIYESLSLILLGRNSRAYCRYFREAVLPLDPALEAALMTEGPPPVFKPCPICGGSVPVDGRMAYCSEACARIALRRQKREYMRKKRR